MASVRTWSIMRVCHTTGRIFTGNTWEPGEPHTPRKTPCGWTSPLFTGKLYQTCNWLNMRQSLELSVSLFPLRTFRLRLRRDAGEFSPNFMVLSEKGPTNTDVSHIYSGTLEGGLLSFTWMPNAFFPHIPECLSSACWISFLLTRPPLTLTCLSWPLQVRRVRFAMALCYRVSSKEPSTQTMGLIT